VALIRSQRRGRARAWQLDDEGAGQTTLGDVVREAPAAEVETEQAQAPAAVEPAPPAAGKHSRPADVPAPRAVVVIFSARRWCCPDCLTEVAAPRVAGTRVAAAPARPRSPAGRGGSPSSAGSASDPRPGRIRARPA
jgi:hypothetical protein